MKPIMKVISKLLFYFLVIGMLVLNASYGLRFVGRLFPDDWIIQWASLLLFDGGALIWFIAFLWGGEGEWQRGVALLATALDLLGAFAIALTEVFTAGAGFLTNPEIVDTLKTSAVYVLVIWLIFNVIFVYIFHATDPKTLEEISIRSMEDRITAQAMKETDTRVNMIAASVSSKMSLAMERNVLYRLQSASGVQLLAPGGEIVDVEYQEVNAVPKKRGFRWPWEKEAIITPAPVANIGTPAVANIGTNEIGRIGKLSGTKDDPIFSVARGDQVLLLRYSELHDDERRAVDEKFNQLPGQGTNIGTNVVANIGNDAKPDANSGTTPKARTRRVPRPGPSVAYAQDTKSYVPKTNGGDGSPNA
jgi:hypothetical protein